MNVVAVVLRFQNSEKMARLPKAYLVASGRSGRGRFFEREGGSLGRE